MGIVSINLVTLVKGSRMCGIVGLYAFRGTLPHRERWPDLVNHLRHRGPDEGAWWADGRTFFGHRRLSILDLEGGQQPMATEDGRLVVTFNGEIYNYIELREVLAACGHNFRTTSDTEILLHGYREWGERLPEHLTGMFAFALADREKGELFLARDRFGEKPLFFFRNSDYFAFASELRPLAALPDLERKMDPEALAGYLCLNYVPGNRSLMAGIERLPPAAWLRVGPGGLQRGTYWSPPQAPECGPPPPMSEVLEEFQERFDRAVHLNLRSDVPVGIFLSGGVDSSLVAESALRQGKLNRAYCIGFEEASYSEAPFAETVAHQLGLELEKVILTPKAAERFVDMVEHADDPLADSSNLAAYTLACGAAKKNKVVLGGDGGDELAAGYLTYKATSLHRRWIAPWPVAFRRALAWLGGRLPTSEGKVTFSYKLRRFLRAAHLPSSIAHFTWNGSWLPVEARALLAPGPAREATAGVLERLTQARRVSPRPGLYELECADLREYLVNGVLTKVDRMTMAHGLEARAPFLEHELAQWLLTRPESLKLGPGGQLKHLLRAAARKHFGTEIADRPKQGFSIPTHAWLRGPLREQFEDLLSPGSLEAMGVFNVPAVRACVARHLVGRASLGFELWGLGVLSAWHRARIARPPQAPANEPLTQRVFEGSPSTKHDSR